MKLCELRKIVRPVFVKAEPVCIDTKWADDLSPAQSCKRSFNRFGSRYLHARNK